jgi:tripartite-type tricarboxylate transporter receptor subunit TctC
MKRLSISSALVVIGAVTVLGLGTPTASADPIADFYKGKRIKMIVGSSPGGGYATYARMVARHMGKYIPGKPRFIVQNMDGAGSIVAANFVANVAPKDGTIIAGLQRNVALVEIMGQKGPKFEAEKLNWLGSMASEVGVCVVDKRTGIKSFDEVFTKVVEMAGFGPNDSEIQPALFNNTLGTKFQIVKGYPGSTTGNLSLQRGETNGLCQSWSSFKEIAGKYYTDGNVYPIVQLGLKPDPELSKMGVPLIFKYVTKERVQPGLTVDEVTADFRILFAAKAMGRPFAMAPEVPKARVAAMRKAFAATATDKGYLADAQKQRREVNLVTGEEIQDIVEKMAATPKATLDKLEDLMQFKGVTKMAKVEDMKHTGKVTATKKGGRQITIDYKGKKVNAKVSGSKTKVTVDGKKAKRKAVKVGMTCTFVYPAPGSTAKQVDCKN